MKVIFWLEIIYGMIQQQQQQSLWIILSNLLNKTKRKKKKKEEDKSFVFCLKNKNSGNKNIY